MPSDRDTARRLHPSSLLFSIGSAAWKLLIPGLLILLLSRGRDPEIWLMVLFLPALLAAVVRYLTFRYRLAEDELVLREGVLVRNERHIPYARIQNVDLSQNPLHRLFGVAEVKLETAGGEEPEAKMQVLSLRAVERLRQHVYRGRGDVSTRPADGEAVAGESPAAPSAAATPRTVLDLSTGDLMLLGLMSNRGLVLVLGLWGLMWQFGSRDWAPEWLHRWTDPQSIDGQQLEQMLGRSGVDQIPGWLVAVGALAALLALVIVLRLLSIVWATVQFWGFRLTRSGDELGTSYGLLTRRTATVPRHRIQLLTLRQTLMHRWFGRVEIKVRTAGGGKERESESGRQAIAPLVSAERLGRVLAEIHPSLDLDALAWRSVEPRAWRRVRTRTAVAVVLSTAVAGLLGGPWLWIAGAVLLIPALVVARLGFRRLAYAVTDSFVAYRSGWWVRRISVARFAKIQVVALGQTPFDRRYGMASVRVDTAGGGITGHRLRIPFLALATAGELQRSLGLEAARTEFRW